MTFTEERQRACDGCAGVCSCGETAEVPDTEREESAETSGESNEVGALVDNAKRSGWTLSSEGRCERRERRDEALRATIVLE